MNAAKITFIVWASNPRHSELLAQHLNADLHCICYGKRGGIAQTALRYLSKRSKHGRSWAAGSRT